jgi:hypothetical protein
LPDPEVTDVGTVIEALERHGVDFILVGGQAARAWGSPTITFDFDVAYARTRDNLVRVAAALVELDAKLRVGREPDADLPFTLDAETLERGFNFTFRTRFGAVDLLGLPAGVAGYDELEPNAVPMQLFGHTVLVAGLADLLRMKVAAGRPKDRITAEWLAALIDERDRRGMTEP